MTTQEKIKDIIGELEIKRTPYITSIVLEDSHILDINFEGKITMLNVPKKLQNVGLGGLLVDFAIEEGCDSVMAEAFGDGLNQESLIKFYSKKGFNVVATNGNSAYMVIN